MFTITPSRSFMNTSSAAFVQLKTPPKFTFMTSSHSPGSML
jgi:hypothetical protein